MLFSTELVFGSMLLSISIPSGAVGESSLRIMPARPRKRSLQNNRRDVNLLEFLNRHLQSGIFFSKPSKLFLHEYGLPAERDAHHPVPVEKSEHCLQNPTQPD